MFTGIIEKIGKINKIELKNDFLSIDISVDKSFLKAVKEGDSISVNGICLTVVNKTLDTFTIEAVGETVNLTSMEEWRNGDEVNLEKAMKANGRFDGHMVQGHVDSTAEVKKIIPVGDTYVFRFIAHSDISKFLVFKGSITIDGVSLTLIEDNLDFFEVAIIPHTYKHTIFRNYTVGQSVNIETDIIGKYLNKIISER